MEYISFEISTNGKRYTVLTFCSQLTRDVLAIANVLVGTLYGMALLDRPWRNWTYHALQFIFSFTF